MVEGFLVKYFTLQPLKHIFSLLWQHMLIRRMVHYKVNVCFCNNFFISSVFSPVCFLHFFSSVFLQCFSPLFFSSVFSRQTVHAVLPSRVGVSQVLWPRLQVQTNLDTDASTIFQIFSAYCLCIFCLSLLGKHRKGIGSQAIDSIFIWGVKGLN